jgi:hypothetical protein
MESAAKTASGTNEVGCLVTIAGTIDETDISPSDGMIIPSTPATVAP